MKTLVKRSIEAVLIGIFALALFAFLADAQDTQSVVRPTVTVTDFDYGTVAAELSSSRDARRKLASMGINDPNGFASMIGVGAADLLESWRPEPFFTDSAPIKASRPLC